MKICRGPFTGLSPTSQMDFPWPSPYPDRPEIAPLRPPFALSDRSPLEILLTRWKIIGIIL